jgi:NAD(P)-dependent dehydrogenase (short-subunit alcohol dehydrogenase family)
MAGASGSLIWNEGLTISLKGTVSVVIGASEGIGAAIAVGLAKAGSRLVVGGRERNRMSATVDEIRGHGGTVDIELVDVRVPEVVQSFSSAVIKHYGAPTILVNSMGGTLIKAMRDVEVAEWDDLHSTHLRGTFLTCQAFARAMGEKGYGKIINLSSFSAFRGNRLRGVYSVAKAGLNHLTSVLATEWGPSGIRVNGIAPITTRTPRASKQLAREPEREADLTKSIPLGRIATPEDIVGPALFLASPLSDFVSGQTLVVDGGLLMAR